MREFFTKYNTPIDPGEPCSPDRVVEDYGYVSAESMVKSMLLAGSRAFEIRRAQYMFESDSYNDDIDDDSPCVDMYGDIGDLAEELSNIQRYADVLNTPPETPPDPSGEGAEKPQE